MFSFDGVHIGDDNVNYSIYHRRSDPFPDVVALFGYDEVHDIHRKHAHNERGGWKQNVGALIVLQGCRLDHCAECT